MRASDADREQVIDVLKAAFAQGRLVKEELDGRAGQAFAARTYAELAAVTADIPADPTRVQPLPEPARPPVERAQPQVPQVVISWAFGIMAAELFLLLAVFAFPVYGTLGLAVLANTLGLPLVGGLMLDAWRASRPDPQRPREQRAREQRPRGPCSAATRSKVSGTARPTVIRVSARSARMPGSRPACDCAARSERRTAAGFRRE